MAGTDFLREFTSAWRATPLPAGDLGLRRRCLASLLTLLSDAKHIRLYNNSTETKKKKKIILLGITLLNIKYDSIKGSLIALLVGEAAGCAIPRVQSLTWQRRLVPKEGMWGGSRRSGGPGGIFPTSESQNGRVWKGPLWVTQPNPLPKQGHPAQAAQDLVQAGLEYLQRRRLHSPSGQPGPVLRHPQREEVLPHVQTEHTVLCAAGRSQRCAPEQRSRPAAARD